MYTTKFSATRAVGRRLSAFFFNFFLRDCRSNFYFGFPLQFQKNHFIGIFRFLGALAFQGGPAAAARVRAPMRGTAVPGNTPNSRSPPTAKIGLLFSFHSSRLRACGWQAAAAAVRTH
jgi:hypothetical protein